MTSPDFSFESPLWNKGLTHIAGVDEVGRGSFAGPVVVGAVIFPPHLDHTLISQINDSELLKHTKRRQLSTLIKQTATSWSVALSPVSFINRQGIVPATFTAMRRAINDLGNCQHLLIDAFYIPHFSHFNHKNQTPIIKGDQKSFSIAAASIIAKVYRDSLLLHLSKQFPQYGWGHNKGYGTKQHQQALKQFGPTRHHRTLYIKRFLT